MSVMVINSGANVEFVEVVGSDGAIDHVTVQPGGRVPLKAGYSVTGRGLSGPHIHVTGQLAPSKPAVAAVVALQDAATVAKTDQPKK